MKIKIVTGIRMTLIPAWKQTLNYFLLHSFIEHLYKFAPIYAGSQYFKVLRIAFWGKEFDIKLWRTK